MDRGPLDHALEARRGFRVARPVRRQPGEILVEEFGQVGAQLIEIDAAGAQHRGGIRVFRESEQEMLKGRVFVLPIASQ